MGPVLLQNCSKRSIRFGTQKPASLHRHEPHRPQSGASYFGCKCIWHIKCDIITIFSATLSLWDWAQAWHDLHDYGSCDLQGTPGQGRLCSGRSHQYLGYYWQPEQGYHQRNKRFSYWGKWRHNSIWYKKHQIYSVWPYFGLLNLSTQQRYGMVFV